MTTPKFAATARMSNNLSGGRRQPVLADKTLHAIERHNPHLSTSTKVDEMVWKDCVNYKFKRGGASRPPVLEFPWELQVKKMEKIAKELPLLLKEPQPQPRPQPELRPELKKSSKFDEKDDGGNHIDADAGSDHDQNQNQNHGQNQMNMNTIMNMRQVERERALNALNLIKWCNILKHTPMCVPLLSVTGIGKSVKKFIKVYKKYIERGVGLPDWFPDITCNEHPSAIETETSLLPTLERLLHDWQVMASADENSSQACTLRERNTLEDQHIEDYNAARGSTTWRKLFHALHQRESAMIKNKGAKMRKIRDNLASDRPKMQSALTKQKRPKSASKFGSKVTLKNRLLYGDVPSKSGWGSSKSSTIGKMSKLRNESASSAARIAGRTGIGSARNGSISASTSSKGSFSASVLSSSSTVRSVPGKKRKATSAPASSSLSSSSSSTARHTSSASSSRNTFNGGLARRNQRVFELNGGMSMKLPKHKATKRR